jgi:outer membrane protein assembly factor BamD
MLSRIKTILIALVIFASAACGEYGKIYKSKDNQAKYKLANELYNKKDYSRAVPLYEQLRDAYRNNLDSLEDVYLRTAYAYFYMKDFEYASMFFKDFTDNFSRSPKMIECAYMALYCDVLYVGEPDLDQSKTSDVIEALQTFINYYPESEYVAKCNEHIDALRAKRHEKAFAQVMQYFQMQEYKAASAAAVIAIKTYPDIPQKEYLEYISYKAQFLYAMNSVESKRIERLEKAQALLEDYFYVNQQTGEHAKDAKETKEKIQKEITKLKSII